MKPCSLERSPVSTPTIEQDKTDDHKKPFAPGGIPLDLWLARVPPFASHFTTTIAAAPAQAKKPRTKETGSARNPSSRENPELGANAIASCSPTNPPPKKRTSRTMTEATLDPGFSLMTLPDFTSRPADQRPAVGRSAASTCRAADLASPKRSRLPSGSRTAISRTWRSAVARFARCQVQRLVRGRLCPA